MAHDTSNTPRSTEDHAVAKQINKPQPEGLRIGARLGCLRGIVVMATFAP